MASRQEEEKLRLEEDFANCKELEGLPESHIGRMQDLGQLACDPHMDRLHSHRQQLALV